MKLELSIGGKVIIVEAEGAVSVHVREEANVSASVVLSAPLSQSSPCSSAPPAVAAVAPVSVAQSAPEGGLFARLSVLRRELAAAAGVPPYVVFKDAVLHEMVSAMPQSLEEFGQISGVGQAKLEKYGSQFLAVIQGAAA